LRPRDFKSRFSAAVKPLITDDNRSVIEKHMGKQRLSITNEGY